MTINRVWAMPNARTFSIPPIESLIKRVIAEKQIIIDPEAVPDDNYFDIDI